MDKIKPYYILDYKPADLSEEDIMDHLKFKRIPFKKDGIIYSFTPDVPQGDLEYHLDIVDRIRRRKEFLKKKNGGTKA
jgi:hypothetical protein